MSSITCCITATSVSIVVNGTAGDFLFFMLNMFNPHRQSHSNKNMQLQSQIVVVSPGKMSKRISWLTFSTDSVSSLYLMKDLLFSIGGPPVLSYLESLATSRRGLSLFAVTSCDLAARLPEQRAEMGKEARVVAKS